MIIKLIKKYYSFIPFIGICLILIGKSWSFEIHDFANYYFGGLFQKNGIFNNQVYFPIDFNTTIKSMGWDGIFVSFAPNTPFLALLFTPLSFLDIEIAKLVFNSLSFLLLLISLIRLSQYLELEPKVMLLIPFIFISPIMNNILFGQVYFFLLFLLIEGFLAYALKKHGIMAIFWSIAILLKIFPIFLFGLLLVNKDLKGFFKLLSSVLILLLFCLLLQGTNVWIFYIQEVFSRSLNGEIAGKFVDSYQSLLMFLKRLMVYNKVENTNPLIMGNSTFFFVLNFMKYSILLLAIWSINSYRKKKGNHLYFGFSILLFTSYILSPMSVSYGLLLLLPISLYLLNKIKTPLPSICMSLFLFFIYNQNFFTWNSFPFNYLKLFGLLLILGYLLSPYLRLKPIRNIGIFSCILSLPFLTKNTSEDSFILLNKKLPILTYDYQLKEDHLIYSYWTSNGQKSKRTYVKHSNIKDHNNLKIIDNQVYLNGSQITYTDGTKLKPLWLNHNTISYLSDDGIGIGFYTVQYISLR